LPERHDEAEVWLGTAEALSRRRGPTARDRLARLHSLARLAKQGGRYSEAAVHLDEALTVAKAEFGATSSETALIHESLGQVLRLLGDYAAERPRAPRGPSVPAFRSC